MGKMLKESLARGNLVKVFCLGQLCNPKWVEIIAYQGKYDAVWLDLEHGSMTLEKIEEAARAARSCGMETFVRLAATDYATVMRPLEAGAGGIMAAQVRDAAQTEQIVQWAKFHPRGSRGFNNTGSDGHFGTLPMHEYMRKANAESILAVQIENRSAVENVEQIAAVPDVDVLFIGPADLSQSLGIPGEWDHPRLWEAIEKVAHAAGKQQIHWAILPLNPNFARRCVDLGCRMLSIGLDVWTVQKGLQALQEEYQEYFKN
ncbi:MAG TPA: aldolase/citrate lyase family protein [Gemmataceae bacterium]|jgi:2-keto-3-deoxy-L-rhamnonate aldolase RhmA|nr:aldolase/citrate lyase family protein [Gemmataceae bacterium]